MGIILLTNSLFYQRESFFRKISGLRYVCDKCINKFERNSIPQYNTVIPLSFHINCPISGLDSFIYLYTIQIYHGIVNRAINVRLRTCCVKTLALMSYD